MLKGLEFCKGCQYFCPPRAQETRSRVSLTLLKSYLIATTIYKENSHPVSNNQNYALLIACPSQKLLLCSPNDLSKNFRTNPSQQPQTTIHAPSHSSILHTPLTLPTPNPTLLPLLHIQRHHIQPPLLLQLSQNPLQTIRPRNPTNHSRRPIIYIILPRRLEQILLHAFMSRRNDRVQHDEDWHWCPKPRHGRAL